MTRIEAEQLVQSLTPEEKIRLNELLYSLAQIRQPLPSTEKSESLSK